MNLIEFRRQHWGLDRVPFMVAPPEEANLRQIFAGRDSEMESAFLTVYDAPRNLLIIGLYGIGKTTFLRALAQQMQETPDCDCLAIYGTLPNLSADIPRTLLELIAKALAPEDPDANRIYQMLFGLESMEETSESVTKKGNLSIVGGEKAQGSKRSNVTKQLADPAFLIQHLIKEAKQRKPERRILIALDDLDKREPAYVRELLNDARPLLHLPCSFVFTAQPLGVLKEFHSTAGNAFDVQIHLPLIPEEGLREIVRRNLAVGRIQNTSHSGYHPFTEEALKVITNRSMGIPRLLNKICFHLLQHATAQRYSSIGLIELKECWKLAGDNLRNQMTGEVARLYEYLRMAPEWLDTQEPPKEVLRELGINSYLDFADKLKEYNTSEFFVGLERDSRTFLTLDPFLEDPPTFPNDTQT